MKILALLLTAGIVTFLAGCNLPILPALTQTPGNASLTATSPSAVNPIIVIVTPLTQPAPTSLAPTAFPSCPTQNIPYS